MPNINFDPANTTVNLQALRYVENKKINQECIDRYLSISANANHWTNFGPLTHILEARIAELLELNDDLRVVVCCNATMALHALVMMQRSYHQHSLKWITSSFGFYSSADGVLAKADIVDCDDQAMLDITQCKPDQYDGIIATNIFGQMTDMENYRLYAEANQKVLLIDSAVGFQAGGHIANECISLHHTKPWGFGECGCAIVHKDHEKRFRSIISFGHGENKGPINRYAMNGKISDIACAYVLMWLEQYDELKRIYNEQYQRISTIALDCGYRILGNKRTHPGIPSNVPLLLPEQKVKLAETKIPVGRYYHPLSDRCKNANNIYQQIVNIPCHRDMQTLSDAELRQALDTILES